MVGSGTCLVKQEVSEAGSLDIMHYRHRITIESGKRRGKLSVIDVPKLLAVGESREQILLD